MNEMRDGRYRLTISHSDDRALTWSRPGVAAESPMDQFRPAIVVDRTGTIGVSWCETVDSVGQRFFAQQSAQPRGRGVTFSRAA